MPKTPESGGIPLPHSWPPFVRSTWDARVASLLQSLGRMGHENEGYSEVRPVLFLTEELMKQKPVEKSENEEEEDIAPTRLLHTFGQRKAFLVKSMDLHRHTIGGGRSGRRGRAECVAFLRYALEVLEEQRDVEIQAAPADEETGIVIGGELGEGNVLTDSEPESSDEEEEEEEVKEPEPAPPAAKPSPKEKPKVGRPKKANTTPSTSKKNIARVVIKNEKDFFDQHNDLCEVCNLPGELLCCATCNLVYHTKCARPKLTKEPDDDWKCAYCISEGVLGGKKEGRERRKAAQACRDMEKMREDLKKAKETSKPEADKKSDEKSAAADSKNEIQSATKELANDKGDNETKDSPNLEVKQDKAVSDVIESKSTPSVESSATKSTPKSAESPSRTTPRNPKPTAKKEAQSEESAKSKASSRASTPCRELEELTAHVPKHLQVVENEVVWSNTGRIQRNRKKPTIYDPKTGPDSNWNVEGVAAGASASDSPTEAIKTTSTEATAAPAETKPPPKKKPGPKKKKKKRKKKAPPKPVRQKIVPDTQGVGALNRLPGTLFDCSACLDCSIKICCYCACRICFNKFGKERTILCDKCDQEYHTFCLNPPLKKLPGPDEPWECPACIEDEKKKKAAETRRIANALKKAEEEKKRAVEEEKREAAAEKRRIANEAKKKAAAEARKKRDEEKARLEALQPKKPPGRPRIHPLPDGTSADEQQPKKRGRGRPRKDGRPPIPRAQSMPPMPAPVPMDETNVERSRSGRKIHRTIFHDESLGGGLAKRARMGDLEPSISSSGFLERSAAAAAKNAIAGATKAGPRRKPGARECMQMSKKFGVASLSTTTKNFDILMDYSKRGKVDHLIRMRERLDDHSRFLELQLAGLEARVKDNEKVDV